MPSSVTRKARAAVGPLAHRALNRAHPVRGRRAFREEFDRLRAAGDPIRVNVGAGKEGLPGWLNTDVVWQVPAYLDVTSPWPVPDGSVDLVFGDDMIEHVTLQQGRAMFRHTFAALRPGGILRLSTPDVEAVARQYLDNGDLARAGLERNRELGSQLDHPVQLLTQVYVGAQHYLGFIYDWAALSTEMQAVGFEVRRVPSGESEHPDLRGLEVRTHPAERATSLTVEGVKPVA